MNFINIFNDIAINIIPIFKKYRNDIKNLKIETKIDKTLVTKADIEIQNIIVEIIRKYDKNANFIAEENYFRRINGKNKFIWIIDSIDGTESFTIPNNIEYCCAICVLENGFPITSMILLPEICMHNKPILAIALVKTNEIYINGILHNILEENSKIYFASTTRSKNTTASKIEEYLINSGVDVKTRTTSQSLDMLQTAIDISNYSNIQLKKFDLFYRENQKIWDGAPGICFNRIVGNEIVELSGNEIIPFSNEFLNQNEPILPSIIVIHPKKLKPLLTL